MISRVNSKLQFSALAVLLMTFKIACAEPQAALQQVLVLQSFDRGNLILDHLTANSRVDIVKGVGRPLNIVQITVGPTGFVGASDQAMVDFIRATYANRSNPDLIVTIAAPAALFARTHRQQLFPDTPVLFSAVDQRFMGDSQFAENETSSAVINDFPQAIDDILQVLPQTNQILMVTGAGPIGKLWNKRLEEQLRRFGDRVRFVWSDDLTLSQLLQRSASLPEHSAIFYLSFGTDSSGAAYADERVIADLHAVASAPLFSAHSVFVGHGIVGSARMSVAAVSHRTADAAIRILNGASPSSIRAPPLLPGPAIFDWRELQRWGIAESRLPPDSVMLYRDASPWHKYRATILAAGGALAVQALLIFWLLLERRARRRAEIDSRKNLALAADVSRREMMSVLGTAFAHDLAQPVASIMCNVEALQVMTKTDPATLGTLHEILSDIKGDSDRAGQIIERYRKMLRSRQLSKKPMDLRVAVRESLALVSHEVKTRTIEVMTELPITPCVVDCDHVLVQQVLVNLLMNAMDAMGQTSQARRCLTIECEVVAADVKVSVHDTGRGLPADMIDSIFTPFFTTKSQGLGIGLTIVDTIIRAHGGSISACNNPGHGATFSFTLPRGDAQRNHPKERATASTIDELARRSTLPDMQHRQIGPISATYRQVT